MILADLIEKVPTKSIGTGQFVIGSTKVRPRIGESFKRDEKMGIYVQLYNFSPDEKTKKPNGTIEYQIVHVGDNKQVLDFTEEVDKIEGVNAQQLTIEKILPLQNMEPGKYQLKMKVVDKVSNQTLTPFINFEIS